MYGNKTKVKMTSQKGLFHYDNIVLATFVYHGTVQNGYASKWFTITMFALHAPVCVDIHGSLTSQVVFLLLLLLLLPDTAALFVSRSLCERICVSLYLKDTRKGRGREK